MSIKLGRQYELTIYPTHYIQTLVPGNTFVDSLKKQVSQISALLQKITSISTLSISSLTSLLKDIQSLSSSVVGLVQSLQGVLGIPAALINDLEAGLVKGAAGLITSIAGATVIPVPFLNNFKNNALNQISSLTQFLPAIPSPLTSFNSFNSSGSGQPITIKNPFTLTFNLKREKLSSANLGTFQIYNLSQSTRSQLYKDKTMLGASRRMTLKAGYGQSLTVIFDGNIKWCTSYRQQGQTNFITEIEAYDWGFPMTHAYTTKTWQGEVKKQDVINQLIKDIIAASNNQVTIGYIHKYTETYQNYSISDYSWPKLCELTENSCHIDCGKINVLLTDESFTGPISQISSATGLLGSPKRSETWTEVEMLFEPAIVVGQDIKLNSSSQEIYNANYNVVGIHHFGTISDAIGGKCQTNVSLNNYQKTKQLIGPK